MYYCCLWCVSSQQARKQDITACVCVCVLSFSVYGNCHAWITDIFKIARCHCYSSGFTKRTSQCKTKQFPTHTGVLMLLVALHCIIKPAKQSSEGPESVD